MQMREEWEKIIGQLSSENRQLMRYLAERQARGAQPPPGAAPTLSGKCEKTGK